MDLATFHALLAAPGQAALSNAMALAPDESQFLAAFETLRKRHDPTLAKAAIETAILRRNAMEKFPDAGKLYFTREALEQATHHAVADYRAAKFHGHVLDLGCGIGADSIALAKVGCRVTAIDADPVRAAMTAANAEILGLSIEVLTGDGLASDGSFDGVFCDPARRDVRGRHLDPDDYSPRPRDVRERFPHAVFKLAPGLRRDAFESLGGNAEFISLRGEMKECCLWPTETRRSATLLPGPHMLTGDPDEPRMIEPVKSYVMLPDAAVIRAGLEASLGIPFLDDRQPLLTADEALDSPFFTRYRVDAVVTGSVGKLNTALRSLSIGRVTWMNLGSPREVEAVRKGVNLNGTEHRTVILTAIHDVATALIVTRV